MKAIVLTLLATILPAAAQRVADFADAKERAKTSRLPIVVLLTGVDWNPSSRKLLETWNRPEMVSKFGGKALLLAVDKKEGKENDPRNQHADGGIRSYPGMALFDALGRLVVTRSGLPEIEVSGGVPRTTAIMLQLLEERDALWQRAAAAQGRKKAELIGAGLDRMNQGLGPANVYQPELDLIQMADPEDRSGYAARYRFSSQRMIGRIVDAMDSARFSEIEEELNRLDRNTRLTKKQRQEVLASRFALYKKWPGKHVLARKALEAARDVDPTSDIGRGAAEYLKMLNN